jgi:hypothetical protein
MVLPHPPLDWLIVIVGYLPENNGLICVLHPFGCGSIVVLQHADGRVGMPLYLCMLF